MYIISVAHFKRFNCRFFRKKVHEFNFNFLKYFLQLQELNYLYGN